MPVNSVGLRKIRDPERKIPMNKTRFILILLAVLALFTLLAGTAGAQEINVDSMSNEELMTLLQTIMQKLEQDTETGKAGDAAEVLPVPGTSADMADIAEKQAVRTPKKYSVYTNKQLVVGRMPDSWFIRRKPGGGGGEDDGGSSGGDTRTLEFHYGDYTFTIDIPEGEYGEYGIPTDVWKAW